MTAPCRILLVEDNTTLRQSLSEQLRLHDEFDPLEAETAEQALSLIRSEPIHAVLLDVGLPDMDGRELCRVLRRSGVNVPILMLTAAESDADTILGLEAGANDYVTKPFRIAVLLARLRAHLRQHAHTEDAVLSIGPYSFQPGVKLLVDPERKNKIRLTEKEAAILKFLYRAGPRVIPRETLLHEVWGYNPGVNTHTLETHIYRLRQKIERDPARSEILITEAGGYRLVP